jgi:hypothetical protein
MKTNYTPTWMKENRDPSFFGPDDGVPIPTHGKAEYLWGNMPALDILKCEDNGDIKNTSRDIGLLFAASGDLHNVVKTIVGLPESYSGHCNVVINDLNHTVVARNIILLLVAMHLDPDIAVPIMLHVWYSALLPSTMVETLQRQILPHIEDVCRKIKDKPAPSIQSKTFKLGTMSVRIILPQSGWLALRDFFLVPKGFTVDMAQKTRKETMCAPSRIDYTDRALYKMTPRRRMGCIFRSEGILLPFGSSTKDFDTPNP